MVSLTTRKHGHISTQIRRPPLWGPPGCEASLCNPVTSVPCILCTLFSVSRLPVSVSWSLESGFSDPGIVVTWAQPATIYHQPGWSQDLGCPQNHSEESSNFTQVSRATRAMKIGPKATKNHENWTCNHLRKLIFAIPPLPYACFCNPRHPNLDPKIIRKSNLEIDMNKNSFFGPKVTKQLSK